MNQTKICPDCKTEYFHHVEKCADCDTALVHPEENSTIQEKREQMKAESLQHAVVIREGDLKWIDELYNVLIENHIPCSVTADTCRKSCCGGYSLLVSAGDAERANRRIEEYFIEVHPEVQASQEMVSQGKCPACSSPVQSDALECPDCGLKLMIVE